MRAKKSLTKPKKTVIFSNDFYSDMRADGMLHALIVRSPFSSGKINSIQLENQEPLPENYAIFTADDIPNQKFITTFGTRTEIFCTGEIKYKGEPVALIAGPDRKTVFELREKVKIILDSRKTETKENSEKNPENEDAGENGQTNQIKENSENGNKNQGESFKDFFEEKKLEKLTAQTESKKTSELAEPLETTEQKETKNSENLENQEKSDLQNSSSFSEKPSESENSEKSERNEAGTFSSESENSESKESGESSLNPENAENQESSESENSSEEKKSGENLNQDFDFDENLEIAAEREVLSGDAESEFKNPENKIIEGIWKNSVTQHEIKETAGCFCCLKGENLHIFTAGRYITHIKDSVSRATGLEKSNIILNCTKKNNQNSNKIWMSSIFAAMASVAALKTGKPVLLALEREDEINFVERATFVKVKNRAAVSKDGTIKAMDIEIEADTGYKNPLASEMLDRFTIAAAGIYSTENLRIRTKIFSSANPPSAVRLNRIDSQVFFALESQIQKICEETGFTPLEIRLKNLRNSSAKSKISKNPFALELGRAEDSMKAVCARSDFNRKYAVYKLAEKGRYETDENSPYSPPLRGIGMAAAFDGNGYLGTNFKNENFSLQVTMTEERKIIVNTAPPSQNIKEIWQKIIIDSLGADKRSIQFNLDLSLADASEKGIASIQNDLMIGNISIKTHLLKKCIEAIKRKKEAVLPITVKKSIAPSKRNQWKEETFSGTPFFSTSFGTCVVEVEYDSCAFSEQVTGVFAVIDCGRIANPQAAETAAKQAIKKCLSTLVFGDSLKCPKIVVQFAQSDDEPKNLDSLIYSILPPAFCSATSQALAITVNELPLKTDSLFKIKEISEKSKKIKNQETQ